MTKTNFLVGMGIGVAVGSLAGMTVSGAKKPPKNIVGKTLKTMGEVVDAVSSSIGLYLFLLIWPKIIKKGLQFRSGCANILKR